MKAMLITAMLAFGLMAQAAEDNPVLKLYKKVAKKNPNNPITSAFDGTKRSSFAVKLTESTKVSCSLNENTYLRLPLVETLGNAWEAILSAEASTDTLKQKRMARAIQWANESFANIKVKNNDDLRDYSCGADTLRKALFNARLEITEVLRRLEGEDKTLGKVNKVDEEVVNQIRSYNRISHYIEDMLGELRFDLNTPEKVVTALTDEKYFLRNPAFDNHELRSGDVILMRGNSFNSAAIGAIANSGAKYDMDSIYSHLGIYYEHSDGKKYIVESLMETGLVATPLEEALNRGEGRFAVYRYAGDPRIAHQSAIAVFLRADKNLDDKKRTVDYNFPMNMDAYDTLFCSQALRYGMDQATDGDVMIPRYPSKFLQNNTRLLDKIGIKVRETFSPADIEVDTRYQLVLNWDYTPLTKDYRMKDMIIKKLFDYGERKKNPLSFKPTLALSAGTKIFNFVEGPVLTWTLKILTIGKVKMPDVPSYYTDDILTQMAALNQTGGSILKAMQERIEKDLIEQRRAVKPYHPLEIMDLVDELTASNPKLLRHMEYISEKEEVKKEKPFKSRAEDIPWMKN